MFAVRGSKSGLMGGADRATPAVVRHTCGTLGAFGAWSGSGFAILGGTLSVFFCGIIAISAIVWVVVRARAWDVGDGLVFTKDGDADRADVVCGATHARCVRRRDRRKAEGCDAVLAGTEACDLDVCVWVEDVATVDIGTRRLSVDHIAPVDGGHHFDTLVGEVTDQDRVGLSAPSKRKDLPVVPEMGEGATVAAQLHAHGTERHFAASARDSGGCASKLRPQKQRSGEQKET